MSEQTRYVYYCWQRKVRMSSNFQKNKEAEKEGKKKKEKIENEDKAKKNVNTTLF